MPKGPANPQEKARQNFQPLPPRVNGGDFEVSKDELIAEYKQKFKKLGDLYVGNPEEKQGAILIDAHYAANAAGATCTARPEDTEIAPNGDLYISFTSGSPDDKGGPDIRVFKGPKNETPYEYGWVMRLVEDGNNPGANTFRWQMTATGGEPSAGGLGFANPDNLLLDNNGNIWMVTDMSTSKMNKAVSHSVAGVPPVVGSGEPVRVKSRTSDKGKPTNLSGLFGNNTLWYIPTSGEDVGKAFLFGIGPMECETTGPCFVPEQQTMFLSIQHPGEANGICKNQASETREFLITTTTGEEFLQSRQVPVGSNWPSKKPDEPPKPAVVAVSKSQVS